MKGQMRDHTRTFANCGRVCFTKRSILSRTKTKETAMTQFNKTIVPVITKDHDGRLLSAIFASREGLVTTEPLQHDTGKAVKATISGLGAGDFVVRSVQAGKRRSFHVLAGAVPAAVAHRIPGFASIVDNRFHVESDAVTRDGSVMTDDLKARDMFGVGDTIVLEDGGNLAEMDGAVRVS
jgi:hypothetical protein